MRRWLTIGVLVVIVIAVASWLSGPIRNCCGARRDPSPQEAAVARRLRALSIPGKAREQKNPSVATPEVLQKAMRHFADHCASCHANNGSGDTEIGRNLYPRAPDMRQAATQNLTDGEIYYIIHNGIRWTGMPAWGASDFDPESWELVHFIRRLPQLTPAELKEMERYNPQSREELEELQREDEFLKGSSAQPSTKRLNTKEPQ
jgi:mono/diheme cytochrome c family protein